MNMKIRLPFTKVHHWILGVPMSTPFWDKPARPILGLILAVVALQQGRVGGRQAQLGGGHCDRHDESTTFRSATFQMQFFLFFRSER